MEQAEEILRAPSARRAPRAASKPVIVTGLYRAFAEEGRSLVEITWEQHRLHESRRWSAVEMVEAVDVDRLTEADRVRVWNAGRAELTTKPGADRVSRLFDAECRRFQGKNDALARVMQACGTWSRYWNEEEAHHEASFNQLSSRLGLEPVGDDTFIEFRKIFPDDDALRTLTLLAISEITAAVSYAQCAITTCDPGLAALFKQVAADEIQHMNYFIAFGQALVDSREYHPKEAFAVAHFFLRDGGDIRGSKREKIERRDTHVNWWDQLRHDGSEEPDSVARKESLICNALKRMTGIDAGSAEEIEDTWMDLVGC